MRRWQNLTIVEEGSHSIVQILLNFRSKKKDTKMYIIRKINFTNKTKNTLLHLRCERFKTLNLLFLTLLSCITHLSQGLARNLTILHFLTTPAYWNLHGPYVVTFHLKFCISHLKICKWIQSWIN